MADPNKINSQLNNLKDLDVADLVKILSEHKNPLAILVLVVGSSLVLMWMFNDHRVKEQFLRTQVSQGKDKIEFIKERDDANQKLKNFTSSLPEKLTVNPLIKLISNYAKLHHITIISLSPADTKSMGLYDVIIVNFNGESNSFKSMILFLRSIEKSKHFLRVDSWTGQEDERGKINFTIEISAVLIHV